MKKITYFNVLVFTVLLLTMGGCNEDKFLKELKFPTQINR